MIKQIFGRLPKKPSKSSNNEGNNNGGVAAGVSSSLGHNSSNIGHTNNYRNIVGSEASRSNNGVMASNNSSVKSSVGKKGARAQGRTPQVSAASSYEALPSFRDVPNSEKGSLFTRKLSICCVIFDFSDPSKNLREKDVKRATLLELVDYISSVSSKFGDTVMQEITVMVAANLFRALPSPHHDNKVLDMYDPEEEEPTMEPSWPHLQIVYEFLLRFVASSETDAKIAKRYIDHSFVLRLLDLFSSEDQREREYLKTILHRIYGKFMVHRPFIRKSINNIFYQFVFETEMHNGIAELLEILGSIINGFALPLKEEHKLFLVRTLIPLHKPKCISLYHQQLSYCITQFVEKDFKLSDTVIRGVLKYWPITNSSKEVMLLSELEEVLEATQSAEFQRCMVPLFRQIGRCLNSSHFQVAERALFLWNNDYIRGLINDNHTIILPMIFPWLEKNARGHWNQAVQSLTLNVRKLFSDADPALFHQCLVGFCEAEVKEKEKRDGREFLWKRIEAVAASNSPALLSQPVLIPSSS